jgi:aspartyl-tRNA(Asn)/glutamyl-tRNA(Gln) amidotransferase subunit A
MNPSTSPAYALQPIADVSEAIRQRKASPVDIVTACLRRIEHLQPRLNAFITVSADAALSEAATAEKEIADGLWRGPLHGIPVGIKDFYDTAGLRTTAAFERFRDRVPRKDAVVVETLKRAGAIVIGKTNMHVLGMGTTGLESWFGAVKNPWHAEYIPGGSSSGSAAAVASGLCYATVDTDAIGSCRLPAACCGVVGYKGSYGLIDLHGILEGEQPPDDTIRWLSHAGLTTRSVRDTALMLEVLAERNHDTKSPWRDAVTDTRQLRVGIATNVKVDERASTLFEESVATIRRLGLIVSDVSAPFVDIRNGVANIERDRESIGRGSFGDIDVLMLPTTATTTPRVKDAAGNPLALSPELTMFANYYGLPAISVPGGFDDDGLPVGVQLVGGPAADRIVLQLASQYERATAFDKRPLIE